MHTCVDVVCVHVFVFVCLLLYVVCVLVFFFFKQKTAYEMRISDWSSDVCSSDLPAGLLAHEDIGGDQHALGHDLQADDIGGVSQQEGAGAEIGRASCRERVCQYV